MAMVYIKLMMLLMRVNGNRVKSKVKEKLYSKVEAYFKVILKTI